MGLPCSSHLVAFGPTRISGLFKQPNTLSNFVSFVRSSTLTFALKMCRISSSFKLSGSKVEIHVCFMSKTRTFGKYSVFSSSTLEERRFRYLQCYKLRSSILRALLKFRLVKWTTVPSFNLYGNMSVPNPRLTFSSPKNSWVSYTSSSCGDTACLNRDITTLLSFRSVILFYPFTIYSTLPPTVTYYDVSRTIFLNYLHCLRSIFVILVFEMSRYISSGKYFTSNVVNDEPRKLRYRHFYKFFSLNLSKPLIIFYSNLMPSLRTSTLYASPRLTGMTSTSVALKT